VTDRRGLLLGGLLLALPGAPAPAQPPRTGPPPRPVARRMVATADGTRLDCWDTGGSGEAVVLLHPNTGSNAVWGHQQRVLADAGYRVVAYSRRGVGASDDGPPGAPASGAADLRDVIDALGIARCHLVGSAGGGFIVPDAALAMPERLSSATIACSLAGIVEESWLADSAMLTPEGFRALPSDFRELSGSYRLANPAGRACWLALERAAASRRIRQPPLNRIDFAALARIAVPTHVITGDADPYLPPARARMLAAMIPGASVAVIAEAAHSAYWEQPAAFNASLLGFLARNRGG
jgi:pimeloyl-ACP methyl ester carboxylesterase